MTFSLKLCVSPRATNGGAPTFALIAETSRFNQSGIVRIKELPIERVPFGYNYNQSTEQAVYFI